MSQDRLSRSFLHKIRICNLGCIDDAGVEVALDEIVCLVGLNNTGKSTVLWAYEAAVDGLKLTSEQIHINATSEQGATVELWIHMPEGAENVGAEWKESSNGLLLVRSCWTWPKGGGSPTRTTWDPVKGEYAEEGNASGLDNVFKSRLPRPFRIGSLEDPAAEHKKLLELVLEPIKSQLAAQLVDKGSPLFAKLRELQVEAEKPVGVFREMLDLVQSQVNTSYCRVFSDAKLHLSISLGDFAVDPGEALTKASHIGVLEPHGPTRWSQQGTGSQRALFWSMLQVRSELNRVADERRKKEKELKKKEAELTKAIGKRDRSTKPAERAKLEASVKQLEVEVETVRSANGEGTESSAFLPGYMLLIDEPETALHLAAVRAAKNYLYSLAAEAGWQVMLSTHEPAFVDPLKDHTTIVRLHRPNDHLSPNVYRSDEVTFSGKEKDQLKALLAFDQSVSEMFFAKKVIIVEGDTEFAAFVSVMEQDQVAFPVDSRPLVLRARGKWTICLLLRMLEHFRIPCAVLHDVDAPRSTGGKKANSAYSANAAITSAVKSARSSGVHVIHRCSVPEFERQHLMSLPEKDKPFHAWAATRDDKAVLRSVRVMLDDLCAIPDASAAASPNDGAGYEERIKAWAGANASGDPAYSF